MSYGPYCTSMRIQLWRRYGLDPRNIAQKNKGPPPPILNWRGDMEVGTEISKRIKRQRGKELPKATKASKTTVTTGEKPSLSPLFKSDDDSQS